MAADDSWFDRGRIPSLDGIRAIAILLVLLAHGRSSAHFPSLGPLEWLTRLGLLGVEIFFSLSGFLITLLLLREFARTGGVNLRGFYIRRFLRIVPAYAILLLAVAALSRWHLAFPTRGDWIAALTYTMNFRPNLVWELGHLWSLSIEEQFYLVWPPVLALAPPRQRVALTLAAMGIALLSRCLLLFVFPAHHAGIHGWTFCRVDSIAAGCLLAVLAWSPASRSRLGRAARIPGAALLVLGVLACSVWVSQHMETWNLSGAFTVHALCITALVWWLAVRHDSHVGRILNQRAMVFIGTLSYSLYLWQELFLNREHHYAWTTFPRNVVFTIAAACGSYYLIEKPFLRLKDRMGAARHGSVAPGPATAPVAAQAMRSV